MLTLKEIIDEVDALVPNPFEAKTKVMWLNAINKEFFEFVKIPETHVFFTEVGQSLYAAPVGMAARNVEHVKVGGVFYLSSQFEDVNPGHNQWTLKEDTHDLLLIPSPYVAGLRSVIRYNKKSSTTFSDDDLTAVPDAPEEYHSTYVYGLCERVAKAMNDVTLANNYSGDYRMSMAMAQQNYGVIPVNVKEG